MPLYIEITDQKPNPAQIRQRKKQRRLYAAVLLVAGLMLAAGEALAADHQDDEGGYVDDGPQDDGPDDDGPTEPQRSAPSAEGGKTCDDYVSLQKVPRWCLRKVAPGSVVEERTKR